MDSTNKRLNQIKSKLSKTTKQWKINISLDGDSNPKEDLWLVTGPSVSKKQAQLDAKFMATAYQDVQYLLNLVEVLQEELSYLESINAVKRPLSPII